MSGSPPRFRDYASSELEQLVSALAGFTELFRREFGLDLYLTWGTLLGAVREGGFIAHDMDVDLAYLSAASVPHEVVEEHEVIVRVLAAEGYAVRPASRGQMHVNIANGRSARTAFDLDIWTTWIADGRYFHYPDIQGELASDSIVPLAPTTLLGTSLLAPAVPADLLEAFYGPRWREPDPDYAWYPRYHSDDVFEFLRTPRAASTIPGRPRRAAGLVSTERGEYFYVSVPGAVEPQRLNATAMLILELCSGERDVQALLDDVQQLYNLDSAPEVVVLDFLAQAAATGLLESDDS